MLSLAFIVVFIFCLAIAIAGIWISRQFIHSYNTLFHKQYFYYLVTFYAFAFYGIWAQILMRVLLASIGTNNNMISMVANFLPILGVPFLFISWIMLVRMGYSITESGLRKKRSVFVIILFTGIIPLIWGIYVMFYQAEWFLGERLAFAEMGLMLFIEFALMLFFAIVAFKYSASLKEFKKVIIRNFTFLMFFGIIIRSVLLPLLFSDIWLVAPIMLLYFLSNFFPLFYLKVKADIIFIPVFAGSPSEEKKALLYEKYSITKREKEIVEAICKGMTNQQIANELFISLQTVKDHTHRIYSKIGINSRLKLVQLVNG